MIWQTSWRNALSGEHVLAAAMSKKANNKEREKREGKENTCEVHGRPHIKQIKNLNAL
jgi:hypothetical protein